MHLCDFAFCFLLAPVPCNSVLLVQYTIFSPMSIQYFVFFLGQNFQYLNYCALLILNFIYETFLCLFNKTEEGIMIERTGIGVSLGLVLLLARGVNLSIDQDLDRALAPRGMS